MLATKEHGHISDVEDDSEGSGIDLAYYNTHFTLHYRYTLFAACKLFSKAHPPSTSSPMAPIGKEMGGKKGGVVNTSACATHVNPAPPIPSHLSSQHHHAISRTRSGLRDHAHRNPYSECTSAPVLISSPPSALDRNHYPFGWRIRVSLFL